MTAQTNASRPNNKHAQVTGFSNVSIHTMHATSSQHVPHRTPPRHAGEKDPLSRAVFSRLDTGTFRSSLWCSFLGFSFGFLWCGSFLWWHGGVEEQKKKRALLDKQYSTDSANSYKTFARLRQSTRHSADGTVDADTQELTH